MLLRGPLIRCDASASFGVGLSANPSTFSKYFGSIGKHFRGTPYKYLRMGISPYNFPTSTASPELKRIVGAGVLEKAEELGVVTKLWAALMAVAYLRGNLQTKPQLLDAALAKAQMRRRGSLPLQFEDIVRQASEILRMAQEDKMKLEGLNQRNPLWRARCVQRNCG